MKSSIFYVITFIFALASITIAVAFIWLINFDKINYSSELNAKYAYLANLKLQELYSNNKGEFEYKSSKYKLKEITGKEKEEIIKNSLVLDEDNNYIGSGKILNYKNDNYLYIRYLDKDFLYKDGDYNFYRYISIQLILSFVILVLLVCYIFVITRLRPLGKLKRQITKFANNDLENIENISTGNDEISQVSDAFYQAICKIKDMNSSRQFFLRNIMHELKTPITKGRITAEMLEDTKFKQRLIGVFDRMVILIDEFAAIEQITSRVEKNKKRVLISHIFDEAKSMLLLEIDNVHIILENNFLVQVDFKLFTTAVKNLLDNALKYSIDNTVRVVICASCIRFYNKGEKLDKSLQYYTEPFTQGNRNINSFGLGLYVVKTILEEHKLGLEYSYEQGFNIFSITKLENIAVI
ncbi:ArsS family sensor histidine kinase [Campylobacter canadensis]|uniref:histidine kinase n=1 Tax=Campylobacter canadensis TaxID=449520 RepID=A0ABS7WTH7_9BACT|nr:ArsS family sensor histidine kinase [Campylobacter canadensis]MBZ7987319.1 HAMP domain-containing histidine kinase [Campylobacter canadensis]MBZ7994798.1 HAMP domain-containing histidine kinase [Campylobacter canadensis]MBZ7996494.1 HAMP domain-containing histidine kinase [Campylobacter canadensis]MBZ7998509.1 HAMP domain-containing histidine kinase [Campylobacter canadensis]MBZ8000225.1 HAMP domain-containing histidine kinase [Campylobacter canadensis]